MYINSKPEFKHCILFSTNVRQEKYIQIQLSNRLNKKRFSFGKESKENYRKAIKAGYEIDNYCDRCLSRDEAIDLTIIKQIAKSINKPHLKVIETPKLRAIWSDYVKFHLALNCWSQSYIHTHIATVSNLMGRDGFPDSIDRPTEALQFLLSGNRSSTTARDRFSLIVGSVDWASMNDRIDRTTGQKWRDCLGSLNSKLQTNKKQNSSEAIVSEEEYIDPFSVAEVEKILSALDNETYSRYKGRHSQYFPYVKFLWLTGCRPSEAIALKWHNVNLPKKKIKFCEAEVMASGKTCRRQGTKTEPFRFFPINRDLEQLLNDLPKENDYVFVDYKGQPIIQHNLSRVWMRLLPQLDIRHRIPYQLRHSMISYHANRGFSLTQLASIVGNSEKVIREHYLKVDLAMINVPVID